MKTLMTEKFAYTIKEVQEAGGGGHSTVYKAINEGKLKAKKRGRSTIILAPDFAEYLKNLPNFRTEEAA